MSLTSRTLSKILLTSHLSDMLMDVSLPGGNVQLCTEGTTEVKAYSSYQYSVFFIICLCCVTHWGGVNNMLWWLGWLCYAAWMALQWPKWTCSQVVGQLGHLVAVLYIVTGCRKLLASCFFREMSPRGNDMKVVYYRKLAMLTNRNNAALHQTVQSCASPPQVAASAPQQKRFSNV